MWKPFVRNNLSCQHFWNIKKFNINFINKDFFDWQRIFQILIDKIFELWQWSPILLSLLEILLESISCRQWIQIFSKPLFGIEDYLTINLVKVPIRSNEISSQIMTALKNYPQLLSNLVSMCLIFVVKSTFTIPDSFFLSI